MALCPLEILAAPHVLMLRDRRADKPGAANNRLKYLSAMFGWAVGRGIMRANPTRDVKQISYDFAPVSIRGPWMRSANLRHVTR
jgi:hypothetical protein